MMASITILSAICLAEVLNEKFKKKMDNIHILLYIYTYINIISFIISLIELKITNFFL